MQYASVNEPVSTWTIVTQLTCQWIRVLACLTIAFPVTNKPLHSLNQTYAEKA